MSILGVGAGAVGGTGFYNDATSTSMRFRRGVGSNTEINRDPSSAGDRKKHTLAFWVKRCKPSDGSQVVLGGFASSYADFIYFRSDDKFAYAVGNAYTVGTDMVFRDTTNWYHIVAHFDVANSTTTDRLKFWVNGVEVDRSVLYGSYPANQDYAFSNTVDQTVGGLTNFGGYELDAYLCDLNFIDGSLVPYTSFGEFKNGIWIPIDIDTSAITYGTNGFRMLFNGTDTDGASTSGTVNANSVGASSVNSNHFHAYSTALANHSALPDNPENNFAVLNPLAKSSSITLSEGSLKWSSGSHNYQGTTATIAVPTSGKWYFECLVQTAGTATSHDFGIGLVSNSDDSSHGSQINNNTFNNGAMYVSRGDSGSRVMVDGSTLGGDNTLSVASGGIMQCAFDADSGKIWFGENNNWYDASYSTNTTANAPSAGANQTATIDANHEYVVQFNGYTSQYIVVANFGADSSFAGNKTSGSANGSDANGIGDFYYDPPTGFLALCTDNLPDTTLSPNQDEQATDYFNTKLYTGNDGTQTITGVGFQPDWVWIKARNQTRFHNVFDSSRGIGKNIRTNSTNAEVTDSDTLTAFATDGFSLGDDSDGARGTNYSTDNYVSWNWLCGGSSPTKTYKVVVVSDSGNKYRFRNSADSATFAQSAVTLDLQEGGTYTFDLSDSTMSGHPLRFSTTSDGTHGGGSEYTTGVTTSGTAGSSGATVTITVASSAPTLYYYCSNHSGMGGQVNTNSTFGSTNFDGSILSVEQASTVSGFGIITYTANNTANSTIGHGLNATPAMLIIKKRSATQRWFVWHQGDPDYYMYLDGNFNQQANLNVRLGDDSSVILPTSKVITLGGHDDTNDPNGATYVCYAFAEIKGYSKFGNYYPNGSTDGVYIHLGFSPKFVMFKSTSATGWEWVMLDNKRTPHNQRQGYLRANEPAVENTSYNYVDFVSNGIKIRAGSGNDINTSGHKVIYMAFASIPEKFSNAL